MHPVVLDGYVAYVMWWMLVCTFWQNNERVVVCVANFACVYTYYDFYI